MDAQAFTDITIIKLCLRKVNDEEAQIAILKKARKLFGDNQYTLMWLNNKLCPPELLS